MSKRARNRWFRKRRPGLGSSAVFCSALLGSGCENVSDPPAPPLCDVLNDYAPVSFDVDSQTVPADSTVQIVGTVSHVSVRRVDSVAVNATLGLVSAPSITDDSTFTFGWQPVDPSVGVVAGQGSISALVFVSTNRAPPDSACQFARALRVQVDSDGTGTLFPEPVAKILSPILDVSVKLESSRERHCVLRCVIDSGLSGREVGWGLLEEFDFEWIAPAGQLLDNRSPVVRWIAPESPGLYQVQVVVRTGTTGLAIGHINIEVS